MEKRNVTFIFSRIFSALRAKLANRNIILNFSRVFLVLIAIIAIGMCLNQEGKRTTNTMVHLTEVSDGSYKDISQMEDEKYGLLTYGIIAAASILSLGITFTGSKENNA